MGSWAISTMAAQSRWGVLQVGPSPWKTALINIQLSGRLVFFKKISKQESIAESLYADFQPYTAGSRATYHPCLL